MTAGNLVLGRQQGGLIGRTLDEMIVKQLVRKLVKVDEVVDLVGELQEVPDIHRCLEHRIGTASICRLSGVQKNLVRKIREFQETKEIYDRIKARFSERPPSWTKKSLLKRANEGGSTVLYWMLYPNLSGMVHGDIRAILTNSNDDTMTVDQPPSTKWVEPALAIGHHALFMALADYNELCGFEYDDQMRAIHAAYDRAWVKTENG